METPTSSLESRNSTPDDDFNHCPITDISLTNFINKHKNHIEELLDSNPNTLEIQVSSPMTTPDYYTRFCKPEENDELEECAETLIGLSRQNQDALPPLDTSSDILDNNSPNKTPPAPITKERIESMKSEPSTPTSPLPLIRHDACLPVETDNNNDMCEINRLMENYDMTFEESRDIINNSNKEYEDNFNSWIDEELPEEVHLNTPCSDCEQIKLNDEDTSILELNENELDKYINDYDDNDGDIDHDINEDYDEDYDQEQVNINREEYLNNMELRMTKFSEELYNKQLYLEQLSSDIDVKLEKLEKNQETSDQNGNFKFDIVLMVAFSWGVYKIVGMFLR